LKLPDCVSHSYGFGSLKPLIHQTKD